MNYEIHDKAAVNFINSETQDISGFCEENHAIEVAINVIKLGGSLVHLEAWNILKCNGKWSRNKMKEIWNTARRRNHNERFPDVVIHYFAKA